MLRAVYGGVSCVSKALQWHCLFPEPAGASRHRTSVQAPHRHPGTTPASRHRTSVPVLSIFSPTGHAAMLPSCCLSSIPGQPRIPSPFSTALSSNPSIHCPHPRPAARTAAGRGPLAGDGHTCQPRAARARRLSLAWRQHPALLSRTGATSLPMPATPPRGLIQGAPAPSSPCPSPKSFVSQAHPWCCRLIRVTACFIYSNCSQF